MLEGSRQYFARVIRAIKECENDGPSAGNVCDKVDGLTGSRTVAALRKVVGLLRGDPTACYLEIGVFHGSTLISIADHFPDFQCFGIDNFSQFDPGEKNLVTVSRRIAALSTKNVTLINMDFEDALMDLEERLQGKQIGVYFVDGAHDYRSQLMALMLAARHYHERVVIFVDDANYEFVRQSTADFLLSHPEFKMIFEAYSPGHPAAMDRDTYQQWSGKWLNGINILVRDSENVLPEMYPPTNPCKQLFVNDWEIHRMEMAELAPEALRYAQAICHGQSFNAQQRRQELLVKYESLKHVFYGRDPDRNTFSAGLTAGRYTDVSG